MERTGVRDVFDCPVCYSEFIRPLQLSCGHTVCSNCVDHMVNNERGGGPANAVMDDLVGGPMRRRQFEEQMRGVLNERRENRDRDPDALPPVPPALAPNGLPPRHPGEPAAAVMAGLGGNYGNMQQIMAYYHRPDIPFGGPQGGYPDMMGIAPLNRYMRMRRGRAGINTRIRCPECRQHTDVPPNGLPVNYKLKELMERFRDDADISNNALSASSTKTSCSSCNEEICNGVYFGCATCPEMTRICSLCIIREHRSHDGIQEYKALTEEDVRELMASMDNEASRGHEFAYKIGDSIGKLNEDAFNLKTALEEHIREYSILGEKLKSMNRNCPKEEAERFVDRSSAITQVFAELEMRVEHVRTKLRKDFNNIKVQLSSDMKKIVAEIKNDVKTEIKQEMCEEVREENAGRTEVVFLSDDDEGTYVRGQMHAAPQNVNNGNITIDIDDDEAAAQFNAELGLGPRNANSPELPFDANAPNPEQVGRNVVLFQAEPMPVNFERDIELAMQLVNEERANDMADRRIAIERRRERAQHSERDRRVREMRLETRRAAAQRQMANQELEAPEVVHEFEARMHITEPRAATPHTLGRPTEQAQEENNENSVSPTPKRRRKQNEKNIERERIVDSDEPGPSRQPQPERRRVTRVTRRHPETPEPVAGTSSDV